MWRLCLGDAWNRRLLLVCLRLVDALRRRLLLCCLRLGDVWVWRLLLSDAWKERLLLGRLRLVDALRVRLLLGCLRLADAWRGRLLLRCLRLGDAWRRRLLLCCLRLGDVWVWHLLLCDAWKGRLLLAGLTTRSQKNSAAAMQNSRRQIRGARRGRQMLRLRWFCCARRPCGRSRQVARLLERPVPAAIQALELPDTGKDHRRAMARPRLLSAAPADAVKRAGRHQVSL